MAPISDASPHARAAASLGERLAPLTQAAALARWQLATTGTPAARDAVVAATAALEAVHADPAVHAALDALRAEPTTDSAGARAIQVLYLRGLPSRGDADTRAALRETDAELRRIFTTYRGSVGGAPTSPESLRETLRASVDAHARRDAWLATMSVGEAAAPLVRKAARLRNQIAHQLGYRDHFALGLTLQELAEDGLVDTLTRVERATQAPFAANKNLHDLDLARRFGVQADALRPWHYSDPFFQRVALPAGQGAFAAPGADALVDIATRFFDGLGLDVRAVLAASDLWPRADKSPYAFCTHIDRARDVRVLCSLSADEASLSTLLHELGHAVYDRYIGGQPWALSTAAHPLVTEAVAMLMGRQTRERDFVAEFGDASQPFGDGAPGELRRAAAFQMQVFARWTNVVTGFERTLYANPDGDHDATWWKLVAKYQGTGTPDGTPPPAWAAKSHVAITPVYYQNYLYGELLASQFTAAMAADTGSAGLVDNLGAGEWLIHQVFRAGASLRWDTLVERATGRPLEVDDFARAYAR